MITRVRRLTVTISALILTLTPLMLAPTATASVSVNQYPLINGGNSAVSITNGPDGALWVGVYGASCLGCSATSYVYRVATSGSMTSYQVTDGSGTYNSSYDQPNGITSGPDGNLWFTLGDSGPHGFIGKLTTSGNVTRYLINPIVNPGAFGITTGPDNNLWFASFQNSYIGSISTSGSFGSAFPLPTGVLHPRNIVTGPDNNLWFTVDNSNAIYSLTTSGAFTAYPISSPAGDIINGPDGALWFTETSGNKIGRIDTSGSLSEYSVPTPSSNPFSITTGPDGALWFTETSGNKIGRIDTTTRSITEYTLPSTANGPRKITTGSDGNLWFTDNNGVGQLNPFVTIPSAPTNLTIPSPTQNPVLSWTTSSGATSYNIYRNGTNVGSTASTTYTDNTAPEGTDSYTVTAVNSAGESLQSNPLVSVLVDRTPPTITYTVSPTPNSAGWNNSPVTVTFTCADNTGGSGIASCSSPQTESADGSFTLSGTAVDNAGNSSSVNVTVNVDTTAPTVSNVSLATDPLPVNQSTTLSANIADNLSGVNKVEYFTGTDPGQGNGTAMTLSNGSATATVGSYAAAGMHTYYVRAEDNAGNWNSPMSVTLDVYNPAGGYAAAHGSVVPNGSTSNPGDTLPTETGNNLKAAFDFTVKYVNSTDTTPTGTSTFTWGSTCNNPHSNCFVVTTDTTVNPAIGSLSWLMVPGDNTATFQGVASLSQGTTNLGNNYPMRVTVAGTTTTSPGHYLLQVFQVGANPDTATPLYQASGDLSTGSVVVHP